MDSFTNVFVHLFGSSDEQEFYNQTSEELPQPKDGLDPDGSSPYSNCVVA